MKTSSSVLRLGAVTFALLAGGVELSSAQTTYYWDGNGAATGSGSTTLAGTWGGGSASTYWGTAALGTTATTAATLTSSDTAVFAANDNSGTANNYNGNYTVALGAAQSVNGLVIAGQNSGVGSATSGGTLTLNLGAFGLTLGAGGLTLNGSNNDPTISGTGTITLAADQTWSSNTAHSFNVSAPIAGNAGAGLTRVLTLGYVDPYMPVLSGIISDGSGGGNLALVVNNFNGTTGGTGTFSVSGTANTFTGSTTITRGSLQITTLKNVGGGASSLGAVTTVGNGTISIGSGANAGTLIYNGSAASTSDRVINLASTTGGVTLSSNSGTAANTLTLTSNLTNASGIKTLTLRGLNLGANTISGVIGDALDASKLSLVKNDVGQWVLGGANTYSGGTTISGGTLSVASTGTLGANVVGNNIVIGGGNLSLSAATNVGANQTLTVNSGGIGVSYTPAGLPTITDNTSTTGGVFGINYTGTGGVTSLASGSLYNGNWFLGSFTTGTFNGTTLGAGNGSTYRIGGGGGTLTLSNSVLVGANNLILGGTGGGTVNLAGANTFTGKTTFQNGTFNVASFNSVVGGTASSTLGAPTTSANGTIDIGSGNNVITVNYTGAGETSDRILNFTGTTGGVTIVNSGTGNLNFTSTLTMTGTGAKLLTLGSAADTFGGTLNTVTNAGGATKVSVTKNGTSNSTWILAGTSTYTGDTNINGGVLSVSDNLPNSYVKLNGNSSTTQAVLQGQGTIARTLSNTAAAGNLSWAAYSGFAAKGGKLTLTFNSNAALTWGGTAFMGTGTNPMVFGSTTADNQVELTNPFTLGDSVSAGFNRIIYVEKGTGGDSALLSGVISLGGGTSANNGFVKTGLGTLILSAANTYTGATVVRAGTLVAQNNSAVGVAGALGTGTGATASNTINLGDATTGAANNPSLLIGGAFTVARPIAINDNGTGNVYSLGGSTNNSSTFSGAITFANSTVTGNTFAITQVATTGGNALNITGGITGGATAATKTINFKNVGAVNVSTGVIADGAGGGKVAVIQSGSGTTTFSSANTYSGSTTISAGILNAATLANFNTASAIGKGSLTNTASDLVLDGGTLQYTGTTAAATNRAYTLTTNGGSFDASGTSTGSATYSGNMTASGTTGSQTLTLTGTGTGTAGGTLGGTVNNGTGTNVTSLTKSGTGLWTLSGANTYTGVTTITGGTLALSAASNNLATSSKIIVGDTAAHSSAVLDVTGVTGGFTVASGKTLAGHGTVTGSATMGAGSILAPGNSAGTLTISSGLTLNNNTAGSLLFDLGTASDKVVVGGLLTLNGQDFNSFTFDTTGGGFGVGTYVLFDATSLSGALGTNLTSTIAGYNATLSLDSLNNDFILTVAVVPEPGTWAMMLGGLALLVVIQRRRAKQV